MFSRLIIRSGRRYTNLLPQTARNISRSTIVMSKQQEPKVIESIDVPGDGMKWVKLRKINWEDQTGRKVRQLHGKRYVYPR